MSEYERVVFEEEGRAGHIRVLASGNLSGDLLDGLAGYIERQRARANALLETGDIEVASWATPPTSPSKREGEV